MNNFRADEIERIIESVPDEEITSELSSVIYSLGRDSETEEEYDYAFSKLLELYKRENETVKAQVIQAFSMMAVLKKEIKILDRIIVEPLILSADSVAIGTNKQIIQEAIEDINFSLKWNI